MTPRASGLPSEPAERLTERERELLRACVQGRVIWNDHGGCWWLWPRMKGKIRSSEIVELPASALDSLAAKDVLLLRTGHRIWISERSKQTLIDAEPVS